MIHKLTKSPFKDVSLNQYQEAGSLFTKALKRRPSRQFEMPIQIPSGPAISPQMMKKAPPSPITKGLIMPKIDYTCDEELITRKKDDDSVLLCRETFNNNNNNSLYCNQELSLAPTQKTQVKYRVPRQSDQQHQTGIAFNYSQIPSIPSIQPQTNISPTEAEYKLILQKTAKILQAYEINKRKQDSERWQLQFQNQKLKQKLLQYEKMNAHRG